MTDNLNVLRGDKQEASPAYEFGRDDLTRRVDGMRRMGRSQIPGARDRMHDYDRIEGKKKATWQGGVSTADVMRWDLAAGKMREIHKAYAVQNTMEGELMDFDHFMFLCYALNGGSQIMPADRASFQVGKSYFEFSPVITILGVDFRRFFRAYANEVVDACRILYNEVDTDNPLLMELREQLINVARKRNTVRCPWLVADCLENATNLSEEEHSVVKLAKAINVPVLNMVDSRAEIAAAKAEDNMAAAIVQGGSGGSAGRVPTYRS